MRFLWFFALNAIVLPAAADAIPVRLLSHELAGSSIKMRFHGSPGTAFCAVYATLDSQIQGRFGAASGQQDDRQACLITDHTGMASDKIRVGGQGLLVINILSAAFPTETTIIPVGGRSE